MCKKKKVICGTKSVHIFDRDVTLRASRSNDVIQLAVSRSCLISTNRVRHKSMAQSSPTKKRLAPDFSVSFTALTDNFITYTFLLQVVSSVRSVHRNVEIIIEVLTTTSAIPSHVHAVVMLARQLGIRSEVDPS